MVSSLSTLVRQRIVPRLALAVHRAQGRPVEAPPGQVRFGDLRRTTPIASDFGYARGGPVDRYYIESFLERARRDVRGRVLEIGDATYTRAVRWRRGRRGPTCCTSTATAPGVTFVGDLADGAVPARGDAFDCVILTQTLHLIYDFGAALRHCRAGCSRRAVCC